MVRARPTVRAKVCVRCRSTGCTDTSDLRQFGTEISYFFVSALMQNKQSENITYLLLLFFIFYSYWPGLLWIRLGLLDENLFGLFFRMFYRPGIPQKVFTFLRYMLFGLFILGEPYQAQIFWLAVWCSGNALVSINTVALHRARLVLGWVTAFGQVNCLIT